MILIVRLYVTLINSGCNLIQVLFLTSAELDQALHVQAYYISSIFTSKACLLQGQKVNFWMLWNAGHSAINDT